MYPRAKLKHRALLLTNDMITQLELHRICAAAISQRMPGPNSRMVLRKSEVKLPNDGSRQDLQLCEGQIAA
jgi:hypothetical protein